jgi:hypothetical protein
MDEKKKTPEEEQEKKAAPAEEKKDEPKADEKPADKADENSADKEQPASDDSQADENGEGTDEPADKPEQPAPAGDKPDEKDEEILRLKTQIAAMQLGVSAEAMEDAVALAESYVRNGSAKDISAALSAVVKKYPDMKGKEGAAGGFKVGAGASEAEEKKPQNKQTAQKRWNKFK